VVDWVGRRALVEENGASSHAYVCEEVRRGNCGQMHAMKFNSPPSLDNIVQK